MMLYIVNKDKLENCIMKQFKRVKSLKEVSKTIAISSQSFNSKT